MLFSRQREEGLLLSLVQRVGGSGNCNRWAGAEQSRGGGGRGRGAAISIADEGGGLRWSVWPFPYPPAEKKLVHEEAFHTLQETKSCGVGMSGALEGEGCEEVKGRSRGELPGSKS